MMRSADSSAIRPRSRLSGVEQILIGTPSEAPSRHLKSPTVIATRYDDIFGVVANLIVCCVGSGPGMSDSALPFEIAVSPRSMVSVTAKVALNAGSSNEGKARRASVASHCVTAYLRRGALLLSQTRTP